MNQPVIFSFWNGPEMSESRKECYHQLSNALFKNGIEHILITEENIYEYVCISEEPLHKSYPYLSSTHKSDYLRCYFMHFFGGGYTDIKQINGDWNTAFTNIFHNINIESELWASGYPEICPDSVANISSENPELYQILRNNYKLLIGCCNFICKPNSPLTTEWYNTVCNILDNKYELLQKYPARHVREGFQDGYDSLYPYPIKWTEILGNVFHPLIYKYREHIDYQCPKFISSTYR